MLSNQFIELLFKRAQRSKEESDSGYFFSLLCAGEALAKMMVLGILSAIIDDKERNRYRLEYNLVHKNGLGDWSKILDDALTGPASQYLLEEARTEQREFTQNFKQGNWQYESVFKIKETLNILNISADELPSKLDLRWWMRLFSILRNKTRGHGATKSVDASKAAIPFFQSIEIIYNNFHLFERPWAYLYRNLSGKYRVSSIGNDNGKFDFLKKETEHNFKDGVYIYFGKPKLISLIESDPELNDFFIANGNFTTKNFEFLSYITDSRKKGTSSLYLTPAGKLPKSETEGYVELEAKGNCLSNIPDPAIDYIKRPDLEKRLLDLLIDDRREIITLFGSGGIGKTSLTLAVIEELCNQDRYDGIMWFSARDVDLFTEKAKEVQPKILSQNDIAKYYTNLVQSKDKLNDKKFNYKKFFEESLGKAEVFEKGCLFIFDNFETVANPLEVFKWIDTFIRRPNKILITTRLNDFNGDYPLQVCGMTKEESKNLIDQTAKVLKIEELLSADYIEKIISLSEGHPYIIKILLGEFADDKNQKSPKHILSKKGEILTALFERTYATLSPCAKRAFMTLAKWNSTVPRIALEAVLMDSIKQEEPGVVEDAVESLFRYSLSQKSKTQDRQELINLPLVASIFGKKKLKISPLKSAIDKDLELLYMFGPDKSNDMSLNLANRLKNFIKNISEKVDKGIPFKNYESILKIICQAYNPGRLILARFHIEHETNEDLKAAGAELQLFLENSSNEDNTIIAWRMLADIYVKLKDYPKNIHALIELAQLSSVPFYEVSDAANHLNHHLSLNKPTMENEQRIELVQPLLNVLEKRKTEAKADDFSRMAWLALNIQQDTKAREYVELGLKDDSENYNCLKLKEKLSS